MATCLMYLALQQGVRILISNWKIKRDVDCDVMLSA